jgi:hypothetical protein
MTIDAWLDAAINDADTRGLKELKPLLEALAQATRALRAADFSPAVIAPDANLRPGPPPDRDA